VFYPFPNPLDDFLPVGPHKLSKTCVDRLLALGGFPGLVFRNVDILRAMFILAADVCGFPLRIVWDLSSKNRTPWRDSNRVGPGALSAAAERSRLRARRRMSRSVANNRAGSTAGRRTVTMPIGSGPKTRPAQAAHEDHSRLAERVWQGAGFAGRKPPGGLRKALVRSPTPPKTISVET
jgi:hypothetical protein